LGSIILAASKTGDRCADAEEAEALAIWEGLKLAVDQDLNPASLESDCAAAVAAVNSSIPPASRIWYICEEIKALRTKLPSCAVYKISRKCNGVAHDLAGLMCNQDSVIDTLRAD
jgi:hypothetical protein